MQKGSGRNVVRSATVSVLCVLLLAACGGSPESMVASAKEYLAKNDRNAASIQLKNALQKNPGFGEARFLLGKINFDSGDYAGAEKELRRAMDAGFSLDETVPLLAKALVLSGQGDKVAELANQSLSDPQAKAALMVAQGEALITKNKRDDAIQLYDSALRLVPGFPTARIAKARIGAFDHRYDEALAEVDDVLKQSPNLPEALSLRGDLMLALNRVDDALKAFEALVAVRPTDVIAHQNVVSLLLRQNKLDDAGAKIAAMRKALGNHPMAVYLQAFLDTRQGKTKEAYDELQQVLRVAPDYVPALMLMATLQLQRSEFVEAQANLAKIVDRFPGATLARRLLVSAYVGLREPSKALETLQPLIKDRTEDVTILNLAGQVYAMAGDFARSEEYFGRAAASDPKNAQLRTRLGASRLAAGETDRAFQDLEAASALDPDNIQADVTLIMAHLRRNEVAKALAAVAVLEKKKPNDPVTFNMKGGVLLANKDIPGAREAFEKALSIKPDFLAAVTNLARLDVADKQLERARKRYEEFLNRAPKDPNGYLQFAEFTAQTGSQPKDVQAILERGVTAVPTALPLRLALVRMLVQGGDTKRALSLAQEAAAAAPDDAAVLELLGRAQVAAGELQQALTTFGKLAAKLPTSPGPLIAMANVQIASKDLSGAEQSLRKALAVKPDSVDAQQRLFAVLMTGKRFDDARRVARDIQKANGKAAVGYVLEGEAYTAAGKPTEAVTAYEEAFRLDHSAQSCIWLHVARLAAGQSAEAAKLATDWLKGNPKDLIFRAYLAERSLKEQKFDQAAQQYRQMVDIAPKNPLLLNNLAWAMGKQGDKGALQVIDKALAMTPNSPVLIDTLGTLQIQFGDAEKGIQNLRKAVSLGPKLPQLQVSLVSGLIKAGKKDEARTEIEAALKTAPENSPQKAELERLRKTL